jgi:hypothetical protein
VSVSHSQLCPTRSVPTLLAELVELGREAWRITERERAVRAEIEALRESEESRCSHHQASEAMS